MLLTLFCSWTSSCYFLLHLAHSSSWGSLYLYLLINWVTVGGAGSLTLFRLPRVTFFGLISLAYLLLDRRRFYWNIFYCTLSMALIVFVSTCISLKRREPRETFGFEEPWLQDDCREPSLWVCVLQSIRTKDFVLQRVASQKGDSCRRNNDKIIGASRGYKI